MDLLKDTNSYIMEGKTSMLNGDFLERHRDILGC